MIRRLVFHIGDPKNGSSSIQIALQTAACTAEGLTIAPQKNLNASPLANALNPRARMQGSLEERWGAFRDWVMETEADIGIVSSEMFSTVPPGNLADVLGRMLPEQAGDARVIAYARPHVPRFLSGFAQRSRGGSHLGSMEAFFEKMRDTPLMRYPARFGRWRAVFGDRLAVRPFQRSALTGGDVVQDFFTIALGDRPFTLAPVPKVNESLTLQEMVGLRVVQAELTKAELPKFLHLPVGGAISRRLRGQPGRSQEQLAMDRALALRIADTYREAAAAMDADYFGQPVMVPALEAATEGTIAAPQPLEPEAHFDPAAIAALRDEARELARLLLERPYAWRQDYQRWIGQRLDEDDDPARKKNIAAVWERLDRICPLLATGRVPG